MTHPFRDGMVRLRPRPDDRTTSWPILIVGSLHRPESVPQRPFLPEAERCKAIEEGEVPDPYWDLVFKRGGFEYLDLVHRLKDAELVGFSRHVHSKVVVLFVRKRGQ